MASRSRRRAASAWLLPCSLLALAAALAAAPARASGPAPATPAASRPAPDGDAVLHIAVVSDLNERYGDQYYRETVHQAVARLQELHPDLVLVTGDMVAGQRPGLDYDGMWEAFHAAVTRPLAELPLAVTPGNHDASAYERYAPERVVYAQQWSDPEVLARHEGVTLVDSADYPFRYAFTLGPVLFVSLDATTRNALDDDQLDWLERVLSEVDREAYPVRILFGHFPLYPFAQGRDRDYLLHDADERARFEGLVRDYGVDAYVSGHHHSYYPGRDPATGMLLVGMGCLGGGPRVLLGEDRVIEDIEDPTERSFVLLEVDRSGVRAVDAFRGPDFGPNDRVDPASLPTRVGLEDLPIERSDLAH